MSDSPTAALLLDLTRRYCEPHRRYHTIRHVADMLWRGRDVGLTDAQVLAVWYHDAVYAVPSATNEADSAALATAQLTAAGLDVATIGLVERIVLDTHGHVPSVDAARAVIDLDLASLADEWPVFERNGLDIRAEHACYGDAEYDAARRRFVAEFLARDRIYWTDWGARLEARARANLRRSLAEPAR